MEKLPVKETIKKFKRILEKNDVYFFTYLHKESFFYYVRYLRFNRPTGILVVHENGSLPTRTDAEYMTAQFNFYNNIVVGVAKNLVREKERNIEPIISVYHTLEQKKLIISHNEDFFSVYNEISKMLKAIIDGQIILKSIYRDMEQIDQESRGKRGFITENEVVKFLELNEMYQKTLYRQGRVQKDNGDNIRFFLEKLKGLTLFNKDELFRIKDVLGTMNALNIKKTREKSLKTFEINPAGKRLKFESGEKGIQQMLGNYSDVTQADLKKNLYPLLRNP